MYPEKRIEKYEFQSDLNYIHQIRRAVKFLQWIYANNF